MNILHIPAEWGASQQTLKTQISERLEEQRNEAIEFLAQHECYLDIHYHAVGIYLQGSQNYGTDHPDSDVDSKFILVPTYSGLLYGKNFTYDFTATKGEKVSIKPLSEYLNLFWKGNINNLEILTTEHYQPCAFIQRLRKEGFADECAELVMGTLWSASIGMMFQKRKSIEKGTETTREFVNQHGYDPKDAGHIVRIYALLKSLYMKKSFTDALNFREDPLFGLYGDIRLGRIPKSEVLFVVEDFIKEISDIREVYAPTNSPDLARRKEQLMHIYVWYAKSVTTDKPLPNIGRGNL